ncbi:MAG: GIY-YIG nuclease family protein [Myxococcota bacterium]
MTQLTPLLLTPPFTAEDLPRTPGAYVIEMVLDARIRVRVGRLGTLDLPAGTYRYYGSARGPGGLRARAGRHLRGDGRPRWHVDHLRARARVTRAELHPGGRECALVARDLEAGWTVPAPRFGSSDCRTCPAHLLRRP